MKSCWRTVQMSDMLLRYCCQCVLAEAHDVCYSCLSPHWTKFHLFFVARKNICKGWSLFSNSNLTFPGFACVCRDEKAGQPLNCLHDYVLPCFWIYITEQTAFQLLCYVPDWPSQDLIWYKPRNTLSSPGNALKWLLYQKKISLSTTLKKNKWKKKEVYGYIHLVLREQLQAVAHFYWNQREIFSI